MAASEADDAAFRWKFNRSLARVEAAVDRLLAEYATAYCERPVHRHVVGHPEPGGPCPSVVWSIDGETMVEFVYAQTGPDRLVVHEIALLNPLRQQLRSRHVRVAYTGGRTASAT